VNKIRLLPVVVVAIAALLVLKTLGLVTNGGYVLGGVGVAQAASDPAAAGPAEGGDLALPGEPTIKDTSPTLTDPNPTLAPASAAAVGGHGGAEAAGGEHAEGGTEDEATEGEHTAAEGEHAPAEGEHTGAANIAAAGTYCLESDAKIGEDGSVTLTNPPTEEGAAEADIAPAPVSFAASLSDCLPSGDAIPVQIDGNGGVVPLIDANATSLSQQQLLERLTTRRTELEKYEQDLALRAAIVDAAEKRIEERAATLEALEAQISKLVDQRTEMETGQFAGIVAMYETMKPKDAALIFNNLEMEVLLRVAKTMSPRKMAPILAEMDPARAQELTVKMASLADQPPAEMAADDLAALPQIVGQ
jgi:flagellar motility protein MotE (MotC chaperone)